MTRRHHVASRPLPAGSTQARAASAGRRLRAALAKGLPPLVEAVADALYREALGASAGRERQARQDKAVAAIEQDSFVRDVIEVFDASLIDSSIKPIA